MHFSIGPDYMDLARENIPLYQVNSILFYFRHNLLLVNVFYGELKYDNVNQEKAYDITNFAGNYQPDLRF